MDITPADQAPNEMRTEEAASQKPSLRRNTEEPGRLSGKGRRGYWIGRMMCQYQGRIKSARRGGQVKQDSKVPGTSRVKGTELRAGLRPGTEVTAVLPLEEEELEGNDC